MMANKHLVKKKRSLKAMGRRGLSLFLSLVMTLSLVQIGAFADNTSPYADRVQNPDPQYQYGLAEGSNSNASESNYDVKISKSAEATNVENQFRITLTVESKDRIVESEEIVGADIVLVFDLSSSMDGDNWAALKSSADSFIERMLGTESSGQNRISIVTYSRHYATLQGWTNSASTAKATYKDYQTASALNEKLKLSSGTNCQAGFYAADQMLDSARENALTYVVYMSDGEANSYYAELTCTKWYHDHHDRTDCYEITTDVAHKDATFADNSYTAEGAEAAKLQAAVLKNNHPDTKVITVGLGTGSNAVLDPEHTTTRTVTEGYWELTCTKSHWHEFYKGCYTWVPPVTEEVVDGNTSVDEFHSGSTDSITSIYDSIATQITLESNPWTVTDHMSDYVEFVPNSVTGSDNVTFEDGVLSWDLEADANGTSQKSFTISYLIKLKDTDNTATSLWGYDDEGHAIWHPTNGDTVLAYKVVKDGTSYPTRTVAFEVPEVRAETYTVTLKHVVDGVEKSSETFTRMGGYQIDLDGQIKNYGYGVQYTGRDKYDTDGYVLTMNAETNTAVITYNYITGYQLTIHYLEKDTNKTVADTYEHAYSNGAQYSVGSPDVAGYKLVNSADTTVSGTISGKPEVKYVYYEKEAYSVTYKFEGTSPAGVNPPVDNNSYDLFDNDEATVLGVTEPTGWTFKGWTVEGGDGTVYEKDDKLAITGNMTLVGTWEKESYELDIVYQLDQNAYNAYQKALADAVVEPDPVDKDAYTDGEGNLDEEAYNNAVEAAEAEAEAETEANIAKVKATWAIGEEVTSYTANNGTIYTTDAENGVYYFAQTDPDTYYVDSTTTVNAVNVGSSFKVTPAANHISFASGEDQTAFFAISNDLFSVTVIHHYVKGTTETTETVGPNTYHDGDSYSASIKDKAGYKFDAENENNDPMNGTINGDDVVIHLYYKAIPYTVTFTFEGETGHGVAEPDDQTRYVNEYASAPSTTVPDGWTFNGWYTKDAETGDPTAYDFNTPITGNVDLYGSWSRNQYKVTYHFTGDAPAGAEVPTDDTTYYYNDKAADKTTTNYDTEYDTASVDYSFDGWYTDASCSSKYNFHTPITGNVDLYGKFTADTAKYPYTIEYYLDGNLQGILNSLTNVPYGSSVSKDTVESRANEAKAKLIQSEGHSYISLDASKTVEIASISDTVANNVAKLYFTTNTYTLTINYWYYPNGSTTAVMVPDTMISTNPYTETLKHGADYSVTSPSIPHYYLENNDDAVIVGTINGQNATYNVYYLERDKFTVTVEYYDIADKGKEDSATKIASDYTVSVYTDATCTISDEYTSGKSITNYTYAETVGDTSDISSAATIRVYFSRDTYTVKVVHVDGAEGAPNQEMLTAQNTTTTVPVGQDYTHAPAAELPANYKQSGDPAITGTTGKGDTVTVTYTYIPKGDAAVTVNYVLVDGEGNEIRTLDSKTTGYKEGDSYNVQPAIDAFETANVQYTRNDITGDPISGTLAKDDHKVITVKYTLNSYDFSVEYYKDSVSEENLLAPASFASAPYGTELNEELVAGYLGNDNWLNALRPSGYNTTNATYITVGSDTSKNVVKVVYTYVNQGNNNNNSKYYDVTVKYVDQETGEEIHKSVQQSFKKNSSYDMTKYDAIEIDGYTYDHTTGDPVTGIANSNKTITVYYVADVEIPDTETPTDEKPTDPAPVAPDEGTDIDESETPKAEVPATGDNLMMWVMAAAVSGIGLIWLTITGKKRKEDEI